MLTFCGPRRFDTCTKRRCKYLRPKEIGVFSFLPLLWLSGRWRKIGINQPLRFTIELLKLKKKLKTKNEKNNLLGLFLQY